MRLELWQDTPEHLGLLVRHNAPEMTDHLGGPETDEKVRERNVRYAALAGKDGRRMFRIMVPADGGEAAAGTVGYWEREWHGATVWEAGWGVLPEFQGRGLAAAAVTALLAEAKAHGKHRLVHAYPAVDHPASNGVCRKAGFTLLGAEQFEYPVGHFMQCNDWQYALWPA
ncbi:GNAT family N-acetyltransferase [Yinghuangia soli]|uniref:GNAT family N-acetyltransferase n=1 Tax=Yinghuangia soli TaxID=2908204 RepID=A0AA41PXV9_9ACTN|nr:GNAT family N-acetyltransferase [Yinghuangia soli]MCF2527914.1 GNAT family N-acetyltransferase [Yinghuangia soli]